jgi:HEAT repeat protein
MRTRAHFIRCLYICAILLAASSCCSESDIPVARKKLFSASARDRNQGALDLAGCGSKAGSAVPRLIELLYDENKGVQSAAAFALRKIDTPQAREALEEATAARRKK